jgi:hypothetical protein
MITTTGKSILAKYMLGQTPSYASYIALGCGAKPLSDIFFSITNKALTSDVATITTSANHNFSVGDYISVYNVDTTFNGTHLVTAASTNTISYNKTATNVTSVAVSPVGKVSHNFTNKELLDFEMLRVPVISRGYADGKLVLTAELPTTERYEISEIGIYPAIQNPSAGVSDSRNLFTFSTSEQWKSQYDATEQQIELTTVTSALDENSGVNAVDFDDGVFTEDSVAFRTNATNIFFSNSERIVRYETPRFFDSSIIMRGNRVGMTYGTHNTDAAVQGYLIDETSPGDSFIILENASVDLTKNSPTDLVKIALSIINKTGTGTTSDPSRINVIIDFIDSEGLKCRFGKTKVPDTANRYMILSQAIGDMDAEAGFAWNKVITVKIYVAVFQSTSLSSNHLVSVDAIRLENVSSPNPLYGLTGYTIIENPTSETFTKENNTQALVEFRFSMDVV